MDSKAAGAALVALGCAAAWQGSSLLMLISDPVPFYEKPKGASAEELLRDWRRMYPGAKGIQARLVVLGAAASAVTAWGLRGGTAAESRAAAAFGACAAANLGIFGYTLAKIMPVNKRLLPEGQVEKEEGEDGIMWLLRKWGEMHGVRTAMGAVALGAAAYGTHALLTRP